LSRSAALLCFTVAIAAAQAGELSPSLQRAMALRGTHADTAVIIRLADALDPQTLAVSDRRQRDNRVWLALKSRTAQRRAALDPFLAEQGATRVRDLWIVNGVAATLSAAALKPLAALPGIGRVELDAFVQGGRTPPKAQPHAPRAGAAPQPEPAALASDGAFVATRVKPEWNIAAVQAPEVWALGHTGQGVVVATMDTGVDLMHPDLQRRWRGGSNSWFDPHGEEDRPADALGHGTQSMGVMVGGAGLGVAPDARWIAVKLYDANGRAHMSDIHLAFQWLLDPDGDPDTLDAPDVVNASWVLSGPRAGSCNLEFAEDIRALRSAGIAVVFAAGNDGPAERTSNSPANNPGALAVGAVDRDRAASRQASRGPSACGSGVFPHLVAPGANVRTTDLSHGGLASYARAAGSSMAAPHVAGTLALLVGAFPSASLAELETALLSSAQDVGEAGPDNTYGFGVVQVLPAFRALEAGVASKAASAGASQRGFMR
jgi:bacillopeptidase F